jgi:hypothetical protein
LTQAQGCYCQCRPIPLEVNGGKQKFDEKGIRNPLLAAQKSERKWRSRCAAALKISLCGKPQIFDPTRIDTVTIGLLQTKRLNNQLDTRIPSPVLRSRKSQL